LNNPIDKCFLYLHPNSVFIHIPLIYAPSTLWLISSSPKFMRQPDDQKWLNFQATKPLTQKDPNPSGSEEEESADSDEEFYVAHKTLLPFRKSKSTSFGFHTTNSAAANTSSFSSRREEFQQRVGGVLIWAGLEPGTLFE
jgi:hypothetical protein